MTATPDAPIAKPGFEISQLWFDTRYRSYTFQFIALLLLIGSIAYLVSNLLTNLSNAGLNISWDFLGDPSGYDINQRPIEYTSQSSHLRASIVGVLNTLIVAFLACVTATFFGVVAGVLRLSKNWIVARLMSVYVEAFRNVPVLIWIIIIFSIMTVSLPGPAAYRGETPDRTMLFDMFAFTNRGIYTPKPDFMAPLFGAQGWSWLLVIAVLVGSFFGAQALSKWATKVQNATGNRPVIWYYTLAIWFVPVAFVLTAMGLSWSFPELRGFNFQNGIQIRGSLIALWFALAIYTGAFIAENVRAGIQAVSKGQTEAAASLGMRPSWIMNLVVLPQALRVIIPPLISQYLNITKNSSLAIAVGYMDVTGTLGGITLNQTGRAIESILLLMLFYVTISLSISALMNVYNNSVKLKER
ncbi:MAG: ABC transporter permease subunit [Pseudomonadota bacterium]